MGIRFFFDEEEQKGVLHIAAFMLGILIYFSIKNEPNLFLSGFLLFFSGIIFILAYLKRKYIFISLSLFMCLLGFFISTAHTYFTNTVFLEQSLSNVVVQGEVESVKNKITTAEVVIKNPTIKGMKETELPPKIKMWVPLQAVKDYSKTKELPSCEDLDELNKISEKRGIKQKRVRPSTDTCLYKRPKMGVIKKGDVVSGFAFNLIPPSPPLVMGGFNQARTSFFDNIGGVGSFSELYIEKSHNINQSWIEKTKESIQQKIAFLNDDTKGVVNALILGDQSLISKPIQILYRTLGLTHILSVSGFHIALITFLVYRFIRFLLTLVLIKSNTSPFLIRRISALVGLSVSFLYVLLSGAEPPAVRSFIMILFLFMCFFFYRSTISIRVIFITAFLLLCYKPSLLLSVSFQLSFIAVLSICVLVKEFAQRLKSLVLTHKYLAFFLGVLAMNVVVTVATVPFVGYHFNKVALYGILGNLCLSFLFSLFIMPLLILSIFMMPFGFEKTWLVMVDYLLQQLHLMGEKITSLPFYMLPVPSFDAWGLVCFTFAFIILCALKKKGRLVGVVLILVSLFSFFTVQKADVIIAREGRLIAVRQDDGTLKLNESYRHRFISDKILLKEGVMPENYFSSQRYQPDLVDIKGRKISFQSNGCNNANLVFAIRKEDYANCLNVYQKEDLKRMGTVYLFIDENKIRFKNLGQTDENRPWGIEK